MFESHVYGVRSNAPRKYERMNRARQVLVHFYFHGSLARAKKPATASRLVLQKLAWLDNALDIGAWGI